MMDNYSLAGAYAAPPCAGCGGGAMPVTPAAPMQADVSSFSYVNPIPKQFPQTANQMTAMQQPMDNMLQPMAATAPTLREIDSYNDMKQGQKQQLMQSGGQMPAGVPGLQPPVNQTLPMTTSPQTAAGSLAPITPTTQPAPISGDSLQYLNGFLRTQIGRAVRVDFLIGTNTLLDKAGILLGVGANYILIRESETDDIVACDFYNIKFVKFFY